MDESVTLAELRVFLALAEHLHFGRTADEVGVTQSRVSQTVARLEASLGGRLFDRSSRRVRLTPLGEQLRDSVAPAVADLHCALRSTRDLARGVGPRMTVGLISQSSAGGPHLGTIIAAFRSRYPGCDVRLVELTLADPLGPLRRGEVDVLCIRAPVEADDLQEGAVLTDERRVLLVAECHPLTRRAEVCWEDLADQAVADVPDLPRELISAVLPRRTPTGRPIPRGPRVRNMSELLAAVAAGTIVHPTAESTPNYRRHPGTVALPLTSAPRSRSALIIPAAGGSAAATALVEVARRVLTDLNGDPAPVADLG